MKKTANASGSLLGNVGDVEVKINIKPMAAAYLALAITVPIIIFFIAKKVIV